MVLARHLFRLVFELIDYGVVNGRWWPLLAVAGLLLLGIAVTAGQAAAPFIYAIF
jgi:hypothetical protein